MPKLSLTFPGDPDLLLDQIVDNYGRYHVLGDAILLQGSDNPTLRIWEVKIGMFPNDGDSVVATLAFRQGPDCFTPVSVTIPMINGWEVSWSLGDYEVGVILPDSAMHIAFAARAALVITAGRPTFPDAHLYRHVRGG